MIVELDPESGSALMEKLDLVPLSMSSCETVTCSFGVGRLDDDVIHTAIEV